MVLTEEITMIMQLCLKDIKTHLKISNTQQQYGFQDLILKVNWMEVLEHMELGLEKIQLQGKILILEDIGILTLMMKVK